MSIRKSLLQIFLYHVSPSFHLGDGTSQKCHASLFLLDEPIERIGQTSAVIDMLHCRITFLIADNEIYNRFRILQTMRVMSTSFFQNQLYYPAHFLVGITNLFHIFFIRNIRIAIATYRDDRYMSILQLFQLINSIPLEMTVDLIVLQ